MRLKRWAASVTAALALAVGGAACGGSSTAHKHVSYETCLAQVAKAHGITAKNINKKWTKAVNKDVRATCGPRPAPTTVTVTSS